jgi:hypothetical protein
MLIEFYHIPEIILSSENDVTYRIGEKVPRLCLEVIVFFNTETRHPVFFFFFISAA